MAAGKSPFFDGLGPWARVVSANSPPAYVQFSLVVKSFWRSEKEFLAPLQSDAKGRIFDVNFKL